MTAPKETVELERRTFESLIDLIRQPGKFNQHEPPMTHSRRVAVAGQIERQIER